MSKGNFLTGLVFGAAAGAIAGILFAPDKGTETRKKIAKKVNDLKTNVVEQVGIIAENIIEKSQMIGGKYIDAFSKDIENPERVKATEDAKTPQLNTFS
jgi:gas vesicle protein